MSKPQITGIKHTDGRSIKLGGIVVKKFNGADGIVRLTWGRIVEFFPAFLVPFCQVEYFKEGVHLVPREVGRQTPWSVVVC